MIVASKYVQKIINDENLAWGKSLENKPEKFLCKLNKVHFTQQFYSLLQCHERS